MVSNCWICEGWAEHHFTYEPGVSDNNPNHDPFVPIKLHLDIDHFEGDLMIGQEEVGEDGQIKELKEGEEPEDPKVYEVHRMIPPGTHKYFYTIGGIVSVAKDQP